MHRLTIEKEGAVFNWHYSERDNILYNADMERIHIETQHEPYPAGAHVRISLGMQCNYSCCYCSENCNKANIIEPCKDYDKFVEALHDFIMARHGDKDHYAFCFWGGEPLFYFDAVKELTPRLKEAFNGKASVGLSTNGQLLDYGKYEFMTEHDFNLGFSYDGLGQFVRNPVDICRKGTVQHDIVQKFIHEKGVYFRFNPVFHKYNPSLVKYLDHVKNLFGADFYLGELALLRVYDERSKEYMLPQDQLENLAVEFSAAFGDIDTYPQVGPYAWRRKSSFLGRYGTLRNDAKHTNCFISAEGYFTVDLQGNLWTCHNNVGQKQDDYGNSLRLGNIYSGEYTPPVFSSLAKRFETRCADCLLQHFCSGGCPMTPSEYDDLNCMIYQYRTLPELYNAIRFVTDGGRILSIEKEV